MSSSRGNPRALASSRRTPRTISPYVLLQELLRDEPWKLLVACSMLNLTTNVQVKEIIWEFFRRWPTANACAVADPDEVRELIRPLGLYNRRTKSIIELSKAMSGGFSGDVMDLPGVGKYASDSYRMFVEGYLVDDVTDAKLRLYLSWAREHRDEDEAR